jgi:hypothetical protein
VRFRGESDQMTSQNFTSTPECKHFADRRRGSRHFAPRAGALRLMEFQIVAD